MCKRWRSGADPAWRAWAAWLREGFILYFAGMLLYPVQFPEHDKADGGGSDGHQVLPATVLREPPSDHPERLRPDLPLTALEVGIERDLGVRPAAGPGERDGESP